MSMTTKNISITEELAAHIDTMVRTGRYANASDYMRDLVRRDQERLTARQELQGLIRDGIESGEPVEMDGHGLAGDPPQRTKQGTIQSMTRRVYRRPKVEQDLIDVYVTIHEDQPAAAEAFLDAAEETICELAEWPHAGPIVELLADAVPGLRKINVKRFSNYLIFYLVAERTVEVIRVLHGARDLSPELRRSLDLSD